MRGIRGIIMALFLGISFLMISCGNAGPIPKEGQAATADGTIINLKEIGDSIKNAVNFMINVEEVDALLKLVGEFAKGIGNKVTQTTGVIAADAGGNNNGQIVAGAYSLISTLNTKIAALKKKDEIPTELKAKLGDVSTKGQAFLDKVKGDTDLCKKDVTDDNAKKALDIKNGSKDKGATELEALNEAVSALLTSAQTFLSNVYKTLEAPAKKDTTVKS